MRRVTLSLLVFLGLPETTASLGLDELATEALSSLPEATFDIKCDGTTPDGTCVINTSRNIPPSAGAPTRLEVKGNILIAAKDSASKVSIISANSLELVAQGWLKVGQGVTLTGMRTLLLQGGRVELTDAVQVSAHGTVTAEALSSTSTLSLVGHASVKSLADTVRLTGKTVTIDWGANVVSQRKGFGDGVVIGQPLGTPCDAVSVVGFGSKVSALQGGITITCTGGNVTLSEGAALEAQSASHRDGIRVTGQSVHFVGNQTTVSTAFLAIVANSSSELAVPLSGVKGTFSVDCSVTVTLATNIDGIIGLGYQGGSWVLNLMTVIAGQIWVAAGQIIRTYGTSCDNRRGNSVDPCSYVLTKTASMGTSALHGAADALHDWITGPSPSSGNVTFDFSLAASSKLVVEEGGRLIAGSMLICAGDTTHLGRGVVVDTTGHGCGPGVGTGKGETRIEGYGCGGGGASHIGRGGKGVKFADAYSYEACAEAGPEYDEYDELDNSSIPTEGASGGACGVSPSGPSQECEQDESSLLRPAHGGGLVWLSAPTFQFGAHVEVKAEGTQGAPVKSKYPNMLSGGGAGGQIFLYTSELETESKAPSLLSVQGGQTTCTAKSMSGAGGGGFIGFSYTGAQLKPQARDGIVSLYNGGTVDPNCKGVLSAAGEAQVVGHRGQAASLRPCGPGSHGMFCNPCPVGTWNDDGLMECNPCMNKPQKGAEYVKESWTNATCEYKCEPGLPNVRSNPKCLDAVDYAFRFFGGVAGCLAILAGLVLVLGFLLWRRALSSKRLLGHGPRDGEASAVLGIPLESLKRCCPQQCFRTPQRQDRRSRTFTAASWHISGVLGEGHHAVGFPHEWLPYHVGRVYLSGSNQYNRPWALDTKVPKSLAGLVAAGPWTEFAVQFNHSSMVAFIEDVLIEFLLLVAPVFAPLLQHYFGTRRAAKLRQHVEAWSDSQTDWQHTVWCLMSTTAFDAVETGSGLAGTSTCPVDISQLKMTLSTDPSGTLAYLDFFDFRRSLYNWAPADLRQEVRVLVAEGDGSVLEPFALRVEDPAIQNISQSGWLGTAYVIVIFNRFARLLSSTDVKSGGGDGLYRLREHVRSYAREFDLANFVEVLMLPEYQPSPQDESRASMRAPQGNNPDLNSFSDLVARQNLEMTQRRSVDEGRGSRNCGKFCLTRPNPRSAASPEASPGADRARQSAEGAADARDEVTAMRLCLVFGDIAAIQRAVADSAACPHSFDDASPVIRERISEGSTSTPATSCRPTGCSRAITSPIGRAELAKSVAAGIAVAEAASTSRYSLHSFLPCCVRLAPASLLVFLVAGQFADFMLCLLQFYTLFLTNNAVCVAWALMPPLLQPLTVIIGPLFLFSEWPRIGRLYAWMQLVSMGGSFLTTFLLLLLVGTDSWFYDLSSFLALALVKGGLHICACTHAVNVEAAADAHFFNLSASTFLGGSGSRNFHEAGHPHTQSNVDELPPTPRRPPEDGRNVFPEAGIRPGVPVMSSYARNEYLHGYGMQASSARSQDSHSSSSYVASPF